MWELVTHQSNLLFSISLCLVFVFGLLEVIILVLGGGSQGFLDQFVPDSLSDTGSLDVSLDTEPSMFIQVLDWLHVGRVPFLIWLIIFLSTYALTGFILQSIFFHFTHNFFPLWIAAPACLFLCMPLVRFFAKSFAKILPQDETTAIQLNELIGRSAIIVLGEAKLNFPAQARVKDQFGQNHYILVEPEQDEIFTQGQTVILTQQTKQGFQATATLT